MTTLVVGAATATGHAVVEQLLATDRKVKGIARSVNSLPEALRSHPNLEVVEATLTDLSDDALAALMAAFTSGTRGLGSLQAQHLGDCKLAREG